MKTRTRMAEQEENIYCKGSTVFRTKKEEIGGKNNNRKIKTKYS